MSGKTMKDISEETNNKVSFGLEGKVAVVTGSAAGLGREIAVAFARHGASLVLADLVPSDETANQIAKTGGRCITVTCDVSNEDAVENMRSKAIAEYKQVDVLINNAGIVQKSFTASEDTPMDDWDRVIRVNLRGTFLCCRQIGKEMVQRRQGSIVNIASTAGFVGIPRATAYCASKAGVVLLTKSLAVEWARYSIRVNAIAPHYLETELTAGVRTAEDVYKGIVKQIPLKRFALPKEVVGTVLLLASDASTYTTGSVIPVDGGFLAQ